MDGAAFMAEITRYTRHLENVQDRKEVLVSRSKLVRCLQLLPRFRPVMLTGRSQTETSRKRATTARGSWLRHVRGMDASLLVPFVTCNWEKSGFPLLSQSDILTWSV
jgi:hypothetical protein